MKRGMRIIAEAGVNHNGSLEMAKDLVRAAARAGADAVKFQTFKASLLATKAAPKATYQLRTTPLDESQLEMLAKLELDEAAHKILSSFAREAGIEFMSSAFDVASQDMLVRRCEVRTIKIPSGELTNPVLLLAFGYLWKDERPCRDAFHTAFDSVEGRQALGKVTLLHCVSAYPAPESETNLLAMDTLRREFGLPVGFSDHSAGICLPVAAAALGAVVIEKHLTLDRSLAGPDHAASLEPDEFAEMVACVKSAVSALGSGRKAPQPSERDTATASRRSIIAARPIRRGEPFTVQNLSTARPGTGVPAAEYWDWIGETARRDFDTGELIS